MELKQYIKDATRTESRIDNVQVNLQTLVTVLKIYVAAGNLLDDLKKNIFYNKPINEPKWIDNVASLMNLPDEVTVDPNSQLPHTLNIDPRLFHAIVGIATESTELVEAILKAFENGTDIDHVNVREELGDLNWYQAIAIDASEADWDQILETNIAKLKHRYPDKFTSENAINRDLYTERKILEDCD